MDRIGSIGHRHVEISTYLTHSHTVSASRGCHHQPYLPTIQSFNLTHTALCRRHGTPSTSVDMMDMGHIGLIPLIPEGTPPSLRIFHCFYSLQPPVDHLGPVQVGQVSQPSMWSFTIFTTTPHPLPSFSILLNTLLSTISSPFPPLPVRLQPTAPRIRASHPSLQHTLHSTSSPARQASTTSALTYSCLDSCLDMLTTSS